MPLIDMPLEKLKEYKGISPVPKDFDEFWDENLRRADELELNIEITPVDFKNSIADCYNLYFNGTGNARVYAKLLVPKHKNGKCPALLHFHGYSGRSDDFDRYLGQVASGYVVAALDCRGQGGYSAEYGEGVSGDLMLGEITLGIEKGPENLLYKHIFLDTFLLSKIVKAQPFVDRERVGAYGGSQGGALTVVCAALDPEIKALAPCYPFLSDYKRVWSMDLAVNAYNGIREYFRKYDPLHEKEDEIFETLGYIDIKNLAKRIRGKMYMFTGLMDTICPPSTQFAVYNNCVCEKKNAIYPDFGHEGLPYRGMMVMEFMDEILKDGK